MYPATACGRRQHGNLWMYTASRWDRSHELLVAQLYHLATVCRVEYVNRPLHISADDSVGSWAPDSCKSLRGSACPFQAPRRALSYSNLVLADIQGLADLHTAKPSVAKLLNQPLASMQGCGGSWSKEA